MVKKEIKGGHQKVLGKTRRCSPTSVESASPAQFVVGSWSENVKDLCSKEPWEYVS